MTNNCSAKRADPFGRRCDENYSIPAAADACNTGRLSISTTQRHERVHLQDVLEGVTGRSQKEHADNVI